MPAHPKNNNWKEDLNQAISTGIPLYKACKVAGINYRTAISHGYKPYSRNTFTPEQVIKAIEEGLTSAQMSRRFNVSKSSMGMKLKQWDLKPKVKKGGCNE